MQNLDEATFGEALTAGQPLIVDFWAPWCAPCRKLAPVIDTLAAENPAITFAKVDVDTNPGLAARYNITSVPTVMAFVDGQPVAESRGTVGKRHVATMVAQLV